MGQLCESSGYLCSVIGHDRVADILHTYTHAHSSCNYSYCSNKKTNIAGILDQWVTSAGE